MEERFKLEIGFYESLAKLFYAVLLCDNSIHKNELTKLNEALHNNFMDVDTKNIYTAKEGLTLIEKKLGDLIVASANVEIVFDEFKTFVKSNTHLFTTDIKIKLWKVINALSYSSAGKNKAEVIILHEVTLLFKNN